MHTIYTPPPTHLFIRFVLRRAVFELHLFFRKSALKMHPKMALACSRSKIPICIGFALWWAVFFFFNYTVHRSAPNDPKMTLICSRSKNIYLCSLYLYTWGPKFCLFRSRISRFRVTVQIWKRVHQMTPIWPWYVQGQRYTYAYYIQNPDAQAFVRFTLRWAVLKLRPSFWKVHQMTLNDLDMFKIKKKYQYAC